MTATRPYTTALRCLGTCALGLVLAGVAGPPARAQEYGGRSPQIAGEDERPGGLGAWFRRVFGGEEPEAPPDPSPLADTENRRPKPLTVPQDTINALKLMAQDWVLQARQREPKVRELATGGYVREYDTFSDQYTIEIERAPEDTDATMIGYVFLDSSHLRTRDHATADAAAADDAWQEEPRKVRMVFRLLERWEFSELAEQFVFNRKWELARVQYKPKVQTPPAKPALPTVPPPQATTE